MKRRGVTVVRQRHSWDCGVASLAMLFGIPYGDVAAAARRLWGTVPPSRRGLVLHHMEALADAVGKSLCRIYKQRDYLQNRTGILGVNGKGVCWAGHWVVLKAGAIVDPDDATVWKIEDYLAKHKVRPATLLVEE